MATADPGDFYAHVSARGDVLGLGLGSHPDEWAERLGDRYIDDVQTNRMRRDYWLIEVSFYRREAVWECANISVQIHRLAWDEDDGEDVEYEVPELPEVLERMYGPFAKRLSFERLRQRLDELGFQVELIPDGPGTEFNRYTVPESPAIIQVVSDSAEADGTGLPAGDVWAIHVTVNADAWKRPRTV